MFPDLVETLALPLVEFVLQVLGVAILQGQVDVLEAIRIVGQVVESGGPIKNESALILIILQNPF